MSIYQRCSFFNSIEILGIMAAVPLLSLLSIKRCVSLILLASLVPSLATLYLLDRNLDYTKSLHEQPRAHHQEQSEFSHLLTLCQFLLSTATACSLTCLRVAMFTSQASSDGATHHITNFFLPARRASAIGFV